MVCWASDSTETGAAVSRRSSVAGLLSSTLGVLTASPVCRPRTSSFLVLGVSAFGLACSVQAEDYTAKAGVHTTHVVARIDKTVLDDGEVQGTALAGFVRLPPSGDPALPLRLAGLRRPGPEVGECIETESAGMDLIDSSELQSDGSHSGQAELIDAGEVDVVTGEGVHSLAPHAFPSAYDLLRGVLYSSRTQDGVSLPAGQNYRLRATLRDLPPALLDNRFLGPDFVDAVNVNGEAWEQVSSLPDSDILELSWSPGPSGNLDHVVVDLSTDTRSLSCRFLDSEAYGAVPLILESGDSWLASASETAEADAVRLSIARTRRTSQSVTNPADAGPYRLEFNFDFSRSKLLPLGPSD